MAERRPNSVLFSLKELRRIEDDRVKAEDAAEKQKREDEQRAKDDAVRRAQEEEQQRQREEADAVRRAQEEQERQAREGQLRLQESERRARVEAEMKLEQSRIAMEIEAKAKAKKLPWPLIGTIIGVLVVAAAGLGYLSWRSSQKAEAEEKARKEAEKREKDAEIARKADEKRYQEEQAALTKKMGDLSGQLASAKSDAQRKALREQLAAERDRSAKLATARAKQVAAEKRAAKKIRLGKCPPNDPLCGIE
jgi:flagellar basal body-associated protein FliL